MEIILAWDSKSHGGKMPEGYLHLTCEQRCQIYALLQSGHSKPTSRGRLASIRRRSAASLFATPARGYRFKACARVLLPLADRIETITYDNGKEFASHVEIATSLRSLSYFAKPYHSWERGLNEHTNGLFRQYFPKGSDLSTVSDTDVQRVEDKLNSRPRRILGYRTPREVFFDAKTLTVALRC
jgi:hypothetical protein